jgi:hypothetical protein
LFALSVFGRLAGFFARAGFLADLAFLVRFVFGCGTAGAGAFLFRFGCGVHFISPDRVAVVTLIAPVGKNLKAILRPIRLRPHHADIGFRAIGGAESFFIGRQNRAGLTINFDSCLMA